MRDETLLLAASVLGAAIPIAVLGLVVFGVALFLIGWKRAAAVALAVFLGASIAAVASAFLQPVLVPGYMASQTGRNLYLLVILAAIALGAAASGTLAVQMTRSRL